MRIITKSPASVIPDITESDRYNSFILVTIDRIRDDGNTVRQIACIVNTDSNALNWYGDDITSDGYEWFWDDDNNLNLIDFIIQCWKAWTDRGSIVKIYIIENLNEVTPTLDNIGMPYSSLRTNIVIRCPDKIKRRGD